eukprot:jgi/Picre1/32799/NNA_008130.t1
MKFTAALLATALFASSVRGQEPEMSRLGLSVKEPVIVERVDTEITVGFLTGPNLPKTQFTIKCVDAGEDCDAPARGNSVEGFLPMTKTQIVETVDGLAAGTDYTCYVETYFRENGKFSVCKEAKVLPGALGFELTYGPFPGAADFSEDDRDQVCTNVIKAVNDYLTPEVADTTTCDIFKVTDGSAVVLGEAIFEDYQNAAKAFALLDFYKDDKEFQEDLSEFVSEGIKFDDEQATANLTDFDLNAPGPYRYDFKNGANRRRLNRKRLML